MRVFVTGASGHIGSAVVPELIQAGHEVIALARSEASAAAVEAMGAQAHRGDLTDLSSLASGGAQADAVIHLAFDHDTMMAGDFAGAVATDLGVVQALGNALVGTGKTFVSVGLAATGDAVRDAVINANPRSAVARTILGFGEQNVRTILVGVPPVTHSSRDKIGFIPMMIRLAREKGVSGYVDEGTNRWPAAHTLDVARVFRLALEKAPTGAIVLASTENGVPVRDIAEAIGRQLNLPAVSIPAASAAEHFAGVPFISLDITMPNDETRRLLDWEPAHPGLLADLDEGHYFTR